VHSMNTAHSEICHAVELEQLVGSSSTSSTVEQGLHVYTYYRRIVFGVIYLAVHRVAQKVLTVFNTI